MDESSEVLETIDTILARAQDVEVLIDWVDGAYEVFRSLGAASVDVVLARDGLRSAAQHLEQIALAIRLCAEHEDRIYA